MKNSDKILVQVIFPVLSRKYDFLISDELTVMEAKKEIGKEIVEFEKNEALFNDTDNYRMFIQDADDALDERISLKEYGIVSGTRIMLV